VSYRLKVITLAMLGVGAIGGCGGEASPGHIPPLLKFGRTGMGPREFNYPRAAAIDRTGRLYVVDKGGRLQALTQAGEFITAWKMPETRAGKPTGLGVAPDGTLFVADTHYSRVLHFSPDGELLGQFGSLGDGPGQFRLPTDTAIADDGGIYVSEYGGNDRVSKFNASQEYLFSFGGHDAGAGRMERPQALVIAPDSTLWAADACNHRICHFDGDGVFLGAFGRPGRGLGELWFPYNLDLLSDGTMAVCEYGNNRVQLFDPETGRSLGVWGAAGRRPGRLAYPWALAVGDDDLILIVDSGNNRVQGIDGRALSTWGRSAK